MGGVGVGTFTSGTAGGRGVAVGVIVGTGVTEGAGVADGPGVGVNVGVNVGLAVGDGVGDGMGVTVAGGGKMSGNSGIFGITGGNCGNGGPDGTSGTSGVVLSAKASMAMEQEMASAMAHIVNIITIALFFMVPPPEAWLIGLHLHGISFIPYNLAGSSASAWSITAYFSSPVFAGL